MRTRMKKKKKKKRRTRRRRRSERTVRPGRAAAGDASRGG
jgi:hypothetical protein